MKQVSILILLSFTLLASCSKESIKTPYNENQLFGVWRLNSVTFNDADGKDINNWVSVSTILSLSDNDSFYRNYIHGSWLLNNTSLRLIPKEPNLINWEYEILELTESTIKLKIEFTESEYCCDFAEFESDEIVTIIETYAREK